MTPRTSVSARFFMIVSLATALTLTACENSTEPQTGQSATPTVSATATATPSPTPAYKPADANGKAENVPVPVLPEAAKANSKEGVEAFARYWFQVMSYAYETGDVGPLAKITATSCEMCEGVKRAVAQAYTNGQWLSGGTFSTPSVSSSFKPQPDQRISVVVQVIQTEIRYWSSAETEYRQPGEQTSTANVAFLRFVEGAWTLDAVNPLR